VINLRKKPYIMLPAVRNPEVEPELVEDADPHMFLYGRVIGIYHAHIHDYRSDSTQPLRRIEFLHVRWLGAEPGWKAGWKARRLDRLGFIPEGSAEAFSFLDPSQVIRGAQLLPAFSQGKSYSLRFRSRLALPSGGEDDWDRYYVNRSAQIRAYDAATHFMCRFVDRDMVWRHLGGAPGHMSEPAPLSLFAYSDPTTASTVQTEASSSADVAGEAGGTEIEGDDEDDDEEADLDDALEAGSGSDDDDGEL
jgi:hypothetical protein